MKLYSTVWNLLSKLLHNKVTGQPLFEEKNEKCNIVWLLNTVRALGTEFDGAMLEILSIGDALERILTYRQSESMENADYVKNLTVLIKVYEQYCGAYGVHMTELAKINNQICEAVDEGGNPLKANV